MNGRAAAVFAALCLASAAASPAAAGDFDVRISSSALRAHVDTLCGISRRRHDNPAGMQKAADYIQHEFASAGLPVQVQHYAFGRASGESDNVIATINPDRTRVVVVGAHYDAAEHAIGADDNASGVAGLIELARALAVRRARIPYQVQFVAYANEEPPYFRTPGMGSFHHAWALYGKRADVRLMISLESIGYYTDRDGSQHYPLSVIGWGRPVRGDFLALVSSPSKVALLYRLKRAFRAATELPVETLCAPRFVPGVDLSDHVNYWRFGFPAMMITDTAFLRNPNYHRPTDRPDTLDYDRMAAAVTGVAACLFAL